MQQQKIPLKTTIHFEQLQNSTKRISVFQGGTRSAKTYNILIWIIIYLCQVQNKIVTICRETLPSLRGTAMRDFFEILESIHLYDVKNHNKTNNEYNLNNNLIEFISIDESQKIRGRKRNILFINEANEINKEAWLQLAFRTTDKIILDYNPSDEFSFIYDDILTRDDAELYISTYLDNPFLPLELIQEIERLKLADPNYWTIYGLGQRGTKLEKVYSNWEVLKDASTYPVSFIDKIYGLDFGFNHPMALIEVGYRDEGIYLKELFYKQNQITKDLINEMPILIPNKNSYIYADHAEPDRIREIFLAGWNIRPAKKDVEDGIDRVKSKKLYIHPDSINLIKEFKRYKWKQDKDGRILDEVVKLYDDLMDAMRYAIYTHDLPKRKAVWYQG